MMGRRRRAATRYQGADYLSERSKRLVIVDCLGEYVAMNEEQFNGMRVIDVQTGALRYRVRGSRMVDVQTGQLAFRIRSNERVIDVMSGQLVFRIRGGERLVDVNSGALRFRLRG